MSVQPINPEDILAILFVGLCFLIPIIGLTARFALKPVVEAIARVRESQGAAQALQLLERRMALLEQEVQSTALLREDVQRLIEDHEFRRELTRPSGAGLGGIPE